MGIDILEEKFQNYRQQHPQNMEQLEALACQAACVQERVRALMDAVTPGLCPDCAAPCCRCMPVEGWFTEGDYFLYRMLYGAPFELRVQHDDGRSCAFLGERGCLLPGRMRPFPCVKVNCKKVNEALAARGMLEGFNSLYDELTKLQEQVWPLLDECLSPTIMQAQQL